MLRFLQNFLFVLGGLAIIVTMMVVHGTWNERQAIMSRLVPVTAEVTDKAYREWRSGKSLRCEYRFAFRYDVNDVTYVSPNVTYWGPGTACATARELLQATRIGSRIEAYHDPVNVARSFAYPDPAVRYYYAIPLLGIALVVLVWIWLVWSARKPPLEPPSRSGTWYTLPPPIGGATSLRLAVAALIWWSLTLPYAYARWRGAALDHVPTWLDGLIALVGTPMILAIAVVTWMRWRAFADPVVAVNVYPLVTGNFIKVRVIQVVHRPLRVHAMQVRIEARYKRGKKDNTVAASLVRTELNTDARQGTRLTQEFDIDVPYIDGFDAALTKYYFWYIETLLDGPGLVDQRSRFPVAVQMSPDPVYAHH